MQNCVKEKNNMITLPTVSKAPENAGGLIRFLVFLIVLLLAFWGINVFRHIKSGNWTTFQKVTDISGILLFSILIFLLTILLI